MIDNDLSIGSDSCRLTDTYCGLVSPHLASLMLEVFKCTQAMSMVNTRTLTLCCIIWYLFSVTTTQSRLITHCELTLLITH